MLNLIKKGNRNVIDWYNVKDYGADNTGTNNSYTSIMAAINAAGIGGIVYFPKGTYRSDIEIVPLENQKIFGDGRRQSYLTTKNASGSAYILSLTYDYIEVSDIGFKGNTNKASNVADIAIVLNSAENCTINNCWCDGQVQRFLFAANYSNYTVIRNCKLEGTRYSNVIELNASEKCIIENSTIYGQNVIGSETGIEYYSNMAISPFVSPIKGMKVHNVRIENVGGNGINFHGVEDGSITDCHIERTNNKGIYITQDEYQANWARASGVRVENNTIVDCSTKSAGDGGASLSLAGITRAVIRNNNIIFRSAAISRYPSAIELGGYENLIEGNYIWQDPRTWRGGNIGYIRYGIIFSPGSNRNIIRNNSIINISYGTHAAGGASTGIGSDGISIQGDGNLMVGNIIEDTRASGTACYVADATARKALASMRIGKVVIQQSDFTAWRVIPHTQTTSGLVTSGDTAWTKIAPPPHFICASQAAMLLLENATVGDVCVRSDLSSPNKVKYLSALPASTVGNWINLVPADTTGLLATGITSPAMRYGIIINTGYNGNELKDNIVNNPCVAEPVNYYYYDNGTGNKWGPFVRKVTINVGSIASLATATQTITFDVGNVRQGSQVHVGVPYDFPTGIIPRGYVASNSITYTVTLVFYNSTLGALDPNSGDFIITVTEV
jgi:hypothetical protein